MPEASAEAVPLLEGGDDSRDDELPTSSTLQEAGRLVALSWPLVAEQLLTYGSYLISMSLVGRLGAFQLSAFVLASAVTNISGLSIVIGLAGAIDTFASQAFGAGNMPMLGIILQRALLVNLAACLLPILLWFLAGHHLLWWAADQAQAAAAMNFAKLWSPVLALHGSSQCVYRWLVGQGVSMPIVASGAACCAAALPINWLLIFRLHWGLPGAAIAAIIIEALYLGLLLCAALVHSARQPPGERPLSGFSKEALAGWHHHLQIAVPAAAMLVMEWCVYEVVNMIASMLPSPDIAVSVVGIAFNINTLMWMPPNALGMAVSAHVGNALGATQASEAKRVTEVGLGMGTAAMAVLALGIQLAGPRLFRIFTPDSGVIHASRAVVPPLAASILACGASATLQGAVRGTGHQALGACANLVSFYVCGLPAIVVVAAKTSWGIGGLWWALCGAAYLQALLLGAAVLRFDWDKEAHRAARRVTAASGARACP